MTDYRELSREEKIQIDNELEDDSNYNKGFNKADVINYVHTGFYCATCWRSSWTCSCSHED